ncbi:T9SS type B sorting domain-containing protein [Mesonia aquimarina]|uniref:T9SS type B sorting domain-containing protein n=1 Tax=Mesonia aquimarina TaxID=1504967 RepID=UPI000EF63086|nr:gliding motility-associated C-terminal domain-containing protein [Mesonia aquimarina]
MKNKLLDTPWLLCMLLIMCAQMSYAQWQNGLWTEKQAYNWYFYEKAGLDFNTSPPTVLLNGELSSTGDKEGVGSISDESGNLLFYTNGVTVWNANHQIMQNGTGLLGNESTSQTGLIVPKPGSSTVYYIFHMEEECDYSPLYFSEVDLSLDNGLGGVTSNKNIQLSTDSVGEHLTAIYNDEKDGVWVIGHKGNRVDHPVDGCAPESSNEFLAYLVSSGGISTSPVSSSIGNNLNYSYGQMKASPDGSKIAISNSFLVGPPSLQVFDFDSATGQLSNPVTLTSAISFLGYGLEFSPNSRFLYTIDQGLSIDFSRVHQFDLEAGGEQDILNSDVVLIEEQLNGFLALQLAPNGKIYMTSASSSLNDFSNLSVVNFPNNKGLDSGFNLETINLGGKQSGYSLPGFIQSYFESGILYEGECPGEEIAFSTIRIPGIDAISWDYGDGNTGTGITPTHTYAQAGTYTVTATITSNGAQQTAETEVTILEGAEARTPAAPLLACGGTNNNGEFDLTSLNDTILDGQNSNTYTVSYHEDQNGAENDVAVISPADSYESATGTVYARVTNTDTGCYAVTPVALETTPQPTAPSVAPITTCDTEALDGITTIDLTQRSADFQENQPDTDLAYFESQGDADNNTNAITDPTAYTNTSNPQVIYVRISNSSLPNCYAVALLDIEVEAASLTGTSLELMGCSPFDLTDIAAEVDSGLSLEYYASEADAEANTNTVENPTAYVTTSQEEQVYVRLTDSNGCAGVAELSLVTGDCKIPEGISPNGDGANDSFDLSFLTATYGGKHISIFNRNGRVVYETNNYSDQWFGQDNNGNNLPTGTYYYVLELAEPHPEYGGAIKKWVYVQQEL